MANFYKGAEIKFTLDIKAPGFDMNEMDFDVEVTSSNKTIKGEKKSTSADGKWGNENVYITRESVENDGETTYEWYVVFNTAELPIGTLTLKVTAYIVDEMAFDGVRTDIAKASLGRLVE